MECKATQKTFKNEVKNGPFLDDNWECRSCGLYPADHPESSVDVAIPVDIMRGAGTIKSTQRNVYMALEQHGKGFRLFSNFDY